MSKRTFSGYRALLPVAIVSALVLGIALERSGAVGDEPRATEVDPTTLRHAEQLSAAFHNAADIAMPSVVTIHSKMKAQPVTGNRRVVPRGQEGENPFEGTPFEEFFKDRGFEFMPQNPMPRREGMGSGVIIDSAGLIMTNNHVVDGADEVVVHLADGREFEADDIKTDPHTDLAVIHISGAGSLPAAKIGDSDKMRIGDWVIAIGSPFELDQTVSAGIISGQGRELSSVRRTKFLQTDAAINPGNSGGPLVNLRGEVVGINTAIATNSGTYNGVGFAIPINLAKWVTSQLILKGSVQRAYLGVGISELTSDLADTLNASTDGVLVTQVHDGTPAEKAGFQAGDVITRFGGKQVSGPRELQEVVERVPLDEAQEVEIQRDGRTMKLTVTPGALPSEGPFATRGPASRYSRSQTADPSTYAEDQMGITLMDLSPELAEQRQLADGGVLISAVEPNEPGFEAGLRAGMVILKVGQTEVKDLESFKAAMKDQSLDKKVLLYVQVQPGANTFVVVK
ncbi:MAG: Do family serine endopeptidase [Planctomycetota bacterium]|nr:MAG: Do family serine endopeptidase [Planctomycetota bacterium]